MTGLPRQVVLGFRVEAKIHVVDIHLRTIRLPGILDHTAPQTVRNVDMVIEPEARMIST